MKVKELLNELKNANPEAEVILVEKETAQWRKAEKAVRTNLSGDCINESDASTLPMIFSAVVIL